MNLSLNRYRPIQTDRVERIIAIYRSAFLRDQEIGAGELSCHRLSTDDTDMCRYLARAADA
jgi:hypothetical protein